MIKRFYLTSKLIIPGFSGYENWYIDGGSKSKAQEQPLYPNLNYYKKFDSKELSV